jgi:hypothetical protein
MIVKRMSETPISMSTAKPSRLATYPRSPSSTPTVVQRRGAAINTPVYDPAHDQT